MKNKKWILVVSCGIMAVFPGKDAAAQGRECSIGGDVLNEVPIWPGPLDMTLEEYRDANRRRNVGL